MSLLGQQGFSQNRDKSRDLRLERERERDVVEKREKKNTRRSASMRIWWKKLGAV